MGDSYDQAVVLRTMSMHQNFVMSCDVCSAESLLVEERRGPYLLVLFCDIVVLEMDDVQLPPLLEVVQRVRR